MRMHGDCKKYTRWRAGALGRGIASALLVLGLVGLLLPEFARAQPELPIRDPDRPWAAEADTELREGRLENAQTMYEALAAEHGDDFGLWLRLALTRLQLGATAPALEAAQRAYELQPEDLDSILMLAQTQAFAGDPQGGIDSLQRGLQLFPENRQLLETMVSISLGLQRWANAAGLLRELMRQHPKESRYQVDLGRILLTQGEFDEALSVFARARELGAPAAICDALEGKVHLAAGQLDLAQARFQSSLTSAPNGDAHGGMGTIEYLRGERGKAIQSFRRALEFAPGDADLHFNLANVLAQTDRLQEAEESYRNSLRLDSRSATTHLNLALLLLNRFAVAEAEQHLRWASQIDPSLPDPHLHLGRIAGALYDYEAAIDHYRRYRTRAANDEERGRIDKVVADLERLKKDSTESLARGEVHLLQALLPSEDGARSLIEKTRQGADFYVLAQQQSELAEVTGVDVGFVDPQGLSPSLRDAVAGLAPGEMSAPLRTERGWFVFRRVQ